jgi:hypothetical protein
MSISAPWAIALGVAGVMGVVLALGVAARCGLVAAPERGLAHVAYLLGGGLTGFTAIAFPPAWPLLAAVVGMLVIRAVQTTRIVDVGLLSVGFGFIWSLLAGFAIFNEMTDPAVYYPGGTGGWFVFGAAVLVFGLAMTVSSVRSARRRGRAR